jgi:hypothetical protein
MKVFLYDLSIEHHENLRIPHIGNKNENQHDLEKGFIILLEKNILFVDENKMLGRIDY